MLSQFLAYSTRRQLWRAGDRILLSVSGGVDSMVMLHLFRRAGVAVAVAHCNFQLRGKEADADQALVQQTASQYGVHCFVESFQTEAHASEHGISVQMAARALRMHWTENLLEEQQYSACATAHHLNDSIETAVFNLAKGTGIAGLRGIQPKTGRWIRPMMFTTRTAIVAYARRHRIDWREDVSNASTKYSRNVIRHKVVSVLKEINPNLEDTFSDTMEKLEAVEKVYAAHIHALKNSLFHREGDLIRIRTSEILALTAPAAELYEVLRPYGFHFDQVHGIIAGLEGTPGRIFESATHIINIDRDALILTQKTKTFAPDILLDTPVDEVKISGGTLHFADIPKSRFRPSADRNTELLDAKKIRYPLCIRKWEPGDSFYPLGMRGKKKVSDFMIDEKIPLTLKAEIPVLSCPEGIIWIIGHRIDDRFKVTGNTEKILKIWLEKDDQSL